MINDKSIGIMTTQILKDYGLYHPPVNLEKLASELEINIKYEDIEDHVSGFIKIYSESDNKDSKAVIVVNRNHHPNRQRFTIAHEFGHYFLHKDKSNVFIDESFSNALRSKRKNSKYAQFHRNNESSLGVDLDEIEANKFAASLLMPEHLLESEIDRLKIDLTNDEHGKRLAKIFQVSVQSLTHRINNLGVVYF
jgi:Zn-dependent peptidase ImmA (M78 family)